MESTRIDLTRHISLQIGALKLCGIWFYIPHSMKNVRFWICVFTRIVLGITMFVIPTGSQLLYVIQLIMSGNAEIQEVAGTFVNTIQDTFGGQLSSTLFLNAAIVGTTAVQIFSIESPLKNMTEVLWVLAYLSIFISNLFIDCYFGNAITVKSMHVATLVFACPWIELPTTMKKNLVLFIAKTQRPLVITAAKLVPVSLETFTKVMNWTYKGFAVMNQMKK